MEELVPDARRPDARQQNRALSGIAWISFAIFILALMDATAKHLVSGDMSSIQLLAVRSWITVPAFLLMALARGGLKTIHTTRLPAHLLRCCVGVAAPALFFLTLKTLPLADTVALFFSGIFIMTALSALWLREHVGIHRWSCVLIGFIGVMIITQPGTGAFRFEAIYVVLGSIAYAVFVLSGRWLSNTESTFALVFYFHITVFVTCSLPMLWLWQPVPTELIVWIFVFAALALIGHFSLTHAFTLAPVGVIAPFEYSAMVWGVILGYLIWGDLPGTATFVGSAVIIASGLYLLHRETLARKRELKAQ